MVFMMLHLIPGDPVQVLFGDAPVQARALHLGRVVRLEDPLDVLDVAGAPIGKSSSIGTVTLTEPPQPASAELAQASQRLSSQEGQKPRVLQEKVRRNSALHEGQRMRANPDQGLPQR